MQNEQIEEGFASEEGENRYEARNYWGGTYGAREGRYRAVDFPEGKTDKGREKTDCGNGCEDWGSDHVQNSCVPIWGQVLLAKSWWPYWIAFHLRCRPANNA